MFVRGASVRRAARDPADRAVQPARRGARRRGRCARRRRADGSGRSSPCLLWLSPRFTSVEGLVSRRRALRRAPRAGRDRRAGESIVVLGVGTEGLAARRRAHVLRAAGAAPQRRALVGLLQRREAVEDAFHDAPPERRPQLALNGFGYWHYGLLLAVIALAAGLKKAIGTRTTPSTTGSRSRSRPGRRSTSSATRLPPNLRAPPEPLRLVTAAAVLATLPLGTELNAAPRSERWRRWSRPPRG